MEVNQYDEEAKCKEAHQKTNCSVPPRYLAHGEKNKRKYVTKKSRYLFLNMSHNENRSPKAQEAPKAPRAPEGTRRMTGGTPLSHVLIRHGSRGGRIRRLRDWVIRRDLRHWPLTCTRSLRHLRILTRGTEFPTRSNSEFKLLFKSLPSLITLFCSLPTLWNYVHY